MEIPEMLCVELLSWMLTKDVLRCTAVSKSFRNIVCEDYFRNLHRERFSLGLNPNTLLFITDRRQADNSFRIRLCLGQEYCSRGKQNPRILNIVVNEFYKEWYTGSWLEYNYFITNACNGLLCITPIDKKQSLMVCNPVTLKYTTVPPYYPDDFFACSYGLGFNLSTKEYIVVGIARGRNFNLFNPVGHVPGKLMVYSLGSLAQPWRHVCDVDFCPCEGPVYADGKLFWIVYDAYAAWCTKRLMVSFDVESEILFVVENVPAIVRDLHPSDYKLWEFKGSVCTILIDESCIEIWVLKDFYESYWERRHKVELPRVPPGTYSFDKFIGLWERDNGVLQIWLQDMVLTYDDRKNPEERCTLYEARNYPRNKPESWNLCANYKPSFESLEQYGCESKEAFVDPIRDIELPPNCYPKWVVFDLDL